jgi:lipopolysaccharide biosynthesis protein
MRLTAALRRGQELSRLRRTERRRSAQLALGAAARPYAATMPCLVFTDQEAERHPLLARTRDLALGTCTSPENRQPTATGRSGRIAVVVHVFYPDLWPALVDRIRRIPTEIDVVVTLVEGHSDHLADSISSDFPTATTVVVPNRGRDMAPFVRVLELGHIGDHVAVLKLHTKASVHRLDGSAWRTRILDSLCPSPEGIERMLELFRRDSRVGIIAPTGGVLGHELWGSNAQLVEALAVRSGVGIDLQHTWFPGGSMFWSRPESLLRLRDARLTERDFEPEAAGIDRTTAHALERFVGVLVAAGGQEVVSADEVPGRLAKTDGTAPA